MSNWSSHQQRVYCEGIVKEYKAEYDVGDLVRAAAEQAARDGFINDDKSDRLGKEHNKMIARVADAVKGVVAQHFYLRLKDRNPCGQRVWLRVVTKRSNVACTIRYEVLKTDSRSHDLRSSVYRSMKAVFVHGEEVDDIVKIHHAGFLQTRFVQTLAAHMLREAQQLDWLAPEDRPDVPEECVAQVDD